jgi:hypothetical protein
MAEKMPTLAEPRVANPFGSVEPVHQSGLVSIEQQRAMAEVQARVVVARAAPRDQIRCVDKLLNACTRPGLAEKALYHFARGGTAINGASIRLAECAAQNWGNIGSGVAELSRHGDMSFCLAYAWDLESNTYVEKKFTVRHWRDTRQGGHNLTDERDIYELIANMGARRVRACILAVIPGDVIELAVQQCEQTLIAKADTSPDAIKKLVDAFAELGVTQPMIEARIQRRVDAIRPAQIVMLRTVYNSIKDGVGDIADHFRADVPLQEVAGEPDQHAEPQTATRPRRGRPRHVPNTEPPSGPTLPPDGPSNSGDQINPAQTRVMFE